MSPFGRPSHGWWWGVCTHSLSFKVYSKFVLLFTVFTFERKYLIYLRTSVWVHAICVFFINVKKCSTSMLENNHRLCTLRLCCIKQHQSARAMFPCFHSQKLKPCQKHQYTVETVDLWLNTCTMPKKGAVVMCSYLGRPKDSLESHMAKGRKIDQGWLVLVILPWGSL